MKSPFGTLAADDFLQEYWQKKPLLVPGAFPDPALPVSPDELAALACDEDVTSRIILEKGGAYPWEVRFGPFEPEDFAKLPATHWTLLVQETDRHMREAADLLAPFRFLPNWRIDDVQVSYAPAHGSAGPHVDRYDVFLIQGLGQRRWQIGRSAAPADVRFDPDLDLHLLRDFEPDEEWVVSAGDLLYLPPRFPHCGTALGDCMTISVGLRAPSDRELVEGFLESAVSDADPDRLYADADRPRAESPGAIGPDILAHVQETLLRVAGDRDAVRRWFGRWVTEPKRGMVARGSDEPVSPADIRGALRRGWRLRRSAVAYFAYISHGSSVLLYACGVEYPLGDELAFAAPLLCGPAELSAEMLGPLVDDPAFARLLANLVRAGCLEPEEPPESTGAP